MSKIVNISPNWVSNYQYSFYGGHPCPVYIYLSILYLSISILYLSILILYLSISTLYLSILILYLSRLYRILVTTSVSMNT